MTNHEATVERYFAFWNADTPEEQRRIATTVFADGVSYHAPVGILESVDAMIDFRGHVGANVGAVRFLHRGKPQFHTDRARVSWEIEVGDGKSFAAGMDVLEFADDGRIAAVSAFLDRAPEGFDAE
ncbi:nuclear transport factor 2 family protein [Fodinicola acaciae]|uniref:nuclear transport factor 2 family protein n=1 Tax=Fodinicola acaciae TaxID=2681555 RepID=UPI0013D3D64A|nr:nuclear transport factor 2 family protein [Fodinicola acaciae]